MEQLVSEFYDEQSLIIIVIIVSYNYSKYEQR